ncbi:MAG TPA: SDR family oxidoreductase [Solirubrobacteraceae bacterium]|jgi:NAD(P)-dependent dehydrogenase (short-subunit alcohol dehydrogenase family)
MPGATTLIVGGTQGLGRRLAEHYVQQGRDVTITGRDPERARSVAAEIGRGARATAFDLTEPTQIAAALESTEPVDRVVLAAIERDTNSVREYDIDRALRLATLKLVGYTETLHCLHPRMHAGTSVLLYGGLAKERPYPGSTTVTAVNGAVTSMVRAFATELAPVRVNALHPGIVGDSPAWVNADEMLERVMERTPTRRLVTMDDVTNAAVFLLENRSVNGVNLAVDGGWLLG